MTALWILGAGGFAKEVCWLARTTGLYEVAGFVDRVSGPDLEAGGTHLRVIGEADTAAIPDEAAFAIGTGDPALIRTLAERHGGRWFPNIIHPTAVHDRTGVDMGRGNIITAHAIFTTAVRIGSFNVFNLACTVGHDCAIGDANVLNPSANISGNVSMGNGNLIGTNATVLQGVRIGHGCTVGAGSVVTKDVGDGLTVIGVPAKPMAR